MKEKSIHRIAEHKLSKRRMLSFREHDAAGIKAGEILENAEFGLWQAAEKYMQRGGSGELAIETVERAIAYWRNNRESLQRS